MLTEDCLGPSGSRDKPNVAFWAAAADGCPWFEDVEARDAVEARREGTPSDIVSMLRDRAILQINRPWTSEFAQAD